MLKMITLTGTATVKFKTVKRYADKWTAPKGSYKERAPNKEKGKSLWEKKAEWAESPNVQRHTRSKEDTGSKS